MTVPLARTPAEAHLYLELHGCDCGETRFEPRSAVVMLDDGDLGRTYAFTCPRCGQERSHTFRLPEIPLPSSEFRYGGDEPSQLLDPGEWVAVAEAYAAAPASASASLPRDGAASASASLPRAVAALEEALKFVPPGAESVPETAFFSERGRALYLAGPGRFDRERLAAVRDTYAELAAS